MKNRQAMILRELDLLPVYHQKVIAHSLEEAKSNQKPATEDVQTQDNVSVQNTEISNSPFPQDDRRTSILRMDWLALKSTVASCVECKLHTTRTNTVFGVGDEEASWLFVGEGPGADEDKRGEPFVGQAGKLLDNMLGAIDLRRGDDVYIANIVKCRPPGNRTPESVEANTCEPYLTRQIELIKPKLIIALGKTAIQNLLNTDAAVGSLRSRLHDHKGIPVIVTYHPAYLLRNMLDKAKAWEDLCFARRTMAGLKSASLST